MSKRSDIAALCRASSDSTMPLCFSTSDFKVESSDRCDAHTLWVREIERERVKVRKRE